MGLWRGRVESNTKEKNQKKQKSQESNMRGGGICCKTRLKKIAYGGRTRERSSFKGPRHNGEKATAYKTIKDNRWYKDFGKGEDTHRQNGIQARAGTSQSNWELF